jgi:uncharacterized membrane protein YbhN (UPF0104 family)
MDDQKKEENLLDIQIITTFVYIGSLILSIYITYNDKVTIANGKGFLSKKQNQNFSIFNRTLVVVLTLIYLYISYENRKIIEKKKGNMNAASLQVLASEISLVSTIIVLYVILKTSGQEYSIISGAGNPNL